jgi:SagB-type dehydrogenase family enzyme
MATDRGGAPGERSDLWSLREDVQVEAGIEDEPVRLRSRWGEVAIERPTRAIREALSRMTLGPISLQNIVSARGEPDTEPARLVQVLDQLQPLIIRTLGFDTGRPLLSVVPLTPAARFRPAPVPPDARVRLSAFAELRTNGHEYALESPLSLHRVDLHRAEAVWLLGSLGQPATAATHAAAAPPQLGPMTGKALAYLAAAGMVVLAGSAQAEQGRPASAEYGDLADDQDPALAGWSQLDLMFHTRRTRGRHDNPVGITYPLGRAGSPQPVVAPRRSDGIPLHRPRWEDLATDDPPLAIALEGRRSIRRYGSDPLTSTELGDLLYRTARVRSLITLPPAGRPASRPPGATEPDPRLSDRPYPGGGACYELELYVTVGTCAGLPSGIYHYDPVGHRLEPVNMDRRAADALLLRAGQDAAMETRPPLLVTMTARFQRLSWKYEGLTYAVALLDTGVLLQSLYLVSTAMGLAPCALGSVDVSATARAFGIDWRTEPAVGQFLVGRFPPERPAYDGQWQPVNDADWPDLAAAALRRARREPGGPGRSNG